MARLDRHNFFNTSIAKSLAAQAMNRATTTGEDFVTVTAQESSLFYHPNGSYQYPVITATWNRGVVTFGVKDEEGDAWAIEGENDPKIDLR